MRQNSMNAVTKAWPLVLGLGVVAVLGAVGVERSKASEPAGWTAMKRDVSRLERDLDDVLLDSPNFLVSGRNDAHGIFLDEVGLILTFDAALVGSDWNGRSWSWSGLKVRNGRVTIHDLSDDDDDDEDRDKDRDKDDDDNDRSDRRSWRERDRAREERRYERGKEELVDFLIDSDSNVDAMNGSQWLMVVGCLRDSRVLDKKDVSRVIVKARVDDLKAHRSGSLSDDALRAKIVIDEY